MFSLWDVYGWVLHGVMVRFCFLVTLTPKVFTLLLCSEVLIVLSSYLNTYLISLSHDKYLKFISLNVRGIDSPIKRKKILTYLKGHSIDVAFIQETHLSDAEHTKLKRDWVGHVYYSSFTTKARGVAILIHKKIVQIVISRKR